MSISKILEYQKVDRELYLLQKDFYALQKNNKYQLLQNAYKEKTGVLPVLNKELDDIINQINELINKINNLDKIKSDLESDLNDFTVDEDFEDYENTLRTFEDDIEALSREASKLNKKMFDIGNENRKTIEQIDNIQKQIAQFKNAMRSTQKEMMIKAKPIADKLQKIAEGIDSSMMAKYQLCRKQWKFPVFMPYTEEGNCSACGMFVKIEVDKHLRIEGDYTECPHCHRILYKN